jgi:hypothetical protein
MEDSLSEVPGFEIAPTPDAFVRIQATGSIPSRRFESSRDSNRSPDHSVSVAGARQISGFQLGDGMQKSPEKYAVDGGLPRN